MEKNKRVGKCEIDIVSKDPSGEWVFVEVKSASANNSGLSAEDNMTKRKIKNFRKAVLLYLSRLEESCDSEILWRMDVITVNFMKRRNQSEEFGKIDRPTNDLTYNTKHYLINHIKNI